MAKGKHVRRHTTRVLAVLGVTAGILVLVLGGMAFAAYRYEQARVDTILPGVSVAGVDVSGMTRAEAVAAVRQQTAAPLGAPLRVTAGGKAWTVTPQELGQRAGVLKAVNRALALNGSMGTFDRFWHRFREESVHRSIPVKFAGAAGVDALVAKVESAVARKPVDAHMTTDGDTLIVVKPKDGRALDTKTATKSLRQALRTHATSVDLPLTAVAPKVTADNLGPTIVVRVDQNMLYLYEGFKISRTFHVATAKPPWVTPAGDWIVDRKAVDPTWYNPAPDGWASGAPLVVPGGPENPMGTRALYITAPGLIRIHGTSSPERPSIGHYESHGCIRMLNEDVEQLYPLVPVGTHVLIIGRRPY
jgi:lipoprotein-anchoring transpeptidase ErfK/SrfK